MRSPRPCPPGRRPRRRCAVALATVGLLVLTSCLDPTTGTPPATGGPAFSTRTTGVTAGQLSHSWRPGCPVPLADLRRVEVSYWGYDGRAHQGELIVHRSVAPAMVRVFSKLYQQRFQIARMQRMEHFGGSDTRSMDANNTHAYNCRYVAGTTRWSEHAYGKSVDINPEQNPYVRGSTVQPESGRPWTDRSLRVPGMIHSGDSTVRAFIDEGWGWGGHWSTSKDYHHFSHNGR